MILLMVAVGGAIGSVARFLLGRLVQSLWTVTFPLGILTVNVLGCFCMGLLTALFLTKFQVPHLWRSMLLVGVLGGFTTFSGFTIDVVDMLDKGMSLSAWSYVFLSVVLCLVATWVGMLFVRVL